MVCESRKIDSHGSNSIVKRCILPLQSLHDGLTLGTKEDVHDDLESELAEVSEELDLSHSGPSLQGSPHILFNIGEVEGESFGAVDGGRSQAPETPVLFVRNANEGFLANEFHRGTGPTHREILVIRQNSPACFWARHYHTRTPKHQRLVYSGTSVSALRH